MIKYKLCQPPTHYFFLNQVLIFFDEMEYLFFVQFQVYVGHDHIFLEIQRVTKLISVSENSCAYKHAIFNEMVREF